MGILDGIRKGILKKEEEIIDDIEEGNLYEETEEKGIRYRSNDFTKRQIREMAAREYVKKLGRNVVIGLAGVAAIGGIGNAMEERINKPNQINNQTTMISELKENVVETDPDKILINCLNEIEDESDIPKFMKELYRQAYEEKNGEEINDFSVSVQNSGTLFDIGDFIVSGGAISDQVADFLRNNGYSYDVFMDQEVYVTRVYDEETKEWKNSDVVSYGDNRELKQVVMGEDFARRVKEQTEIAKERAEKSAYNDSIVNMIDKAKKCEELYIYSSAPEAEKLKIEIKEDLKKYLDDRQFARHVQEYARENGLNITIDLDSNGSIDKNDKTDVNEGVR